MFDPLTYIFGTTRDWTHENNAATFDSLSIWTKKDTRWERKNVTTFVEFLFFHYQIISVKLHKYFHIASISVNNESEMYCEPPRNVVRSTFLLYNIIWFFFLFDFDFNFIWDFDQSQKEIFLFFESSWGDFSLKPTTWAKERPKNNH